MSGDCSLWWCWIVLQKKLEGVFEMLETTLSVRHMFFFSFNYGGLINISNEHLSCVNTALFFRRAPPVDPEILRTMKTVGFIGYAANPRTRPRNQVHQKHTNYILSNFTAAFHIM